MDPVDWRNYYFKFKIFQQKKYSQKEHKFIIIEVISMIRARDEDTAIATIKYLNAKNAMISEVNFGIEAMKQNTSQG